MGNLIWHNGDFKNDDKAAFSPHTRLRLGEGVFNTVLAIDGKLQYADAHFTKLLKNSHIFWPDWQEPETQTLIDAAHELLHKHIAKDRWALNCIISCDNSDKGITLPNQPEISILMRCAPFNWDPATQIHLHIAQNVRRNEGSPLSQIKCSNYGDNILALREAQQNGANEALMINNADHIATATIATFVMIKNGEIITPPLSDGAKDGNTRRLLCDKYAVTERSISPENALNCDGAYLLNSLRGAVPVSSINGTPLPASAVAIDRNINLEI